MTLLSIIITGRNDNYLGAFKRRLEMSLNYNCVNMAQAGRLDDVEIIICDWNSPSPLREALNLNDAARRRAMFLEVTPEVLARNALDGVVFDNAVAQNVAIRRASGEFVLAIPADVFFPLRSFQSLFALLDGQTPFLVDLRSCYMGIRRFVVPWQAAERLNLETLDRYFTLHTNLESQGSQHPGVSSGDGGILVSRELIRRVRGMNETYKKAGVLEMEMARRIGQTMPLVKADVAGVFNFDFFQRPRARSGQEHNPDIVTLSPIYDDDDWGLGHEELPLSPALYRPEVQNQAEGNLPYDRESLLEGRTERPGCLQVTLARLAASLLSAAQLKKVENAAFGLAGRPHKRSWFSRLGFEIMLAGLAGSRASKNENILFADWFQPDGAMRDYLSYAFSRGAHRFMSKWGLEQAHTLVMILAVLGRFRPRRFFYAGFRDFYVAQAASAVDPTMEITAYDHYQPEPYLNNHQPGNLFPPIRLPMLLMEAGYRGYIHILTGPLDTAFERLEKIPFAGEPFQVMFLDLDYLMADGAVTPQGAAGLELYTRIKPFFAPEGCAIILRGSKAKREAAGKDLENGLFRKVGAYYEIDVFFHD